MANFSSSQLKTSNNNINNVFIGPVSVKNAPKSFGSKDYKRAMKYDYDNDGIVDYNNLEKEAIAPQPRQPKKSAIVISDQEILSDHDAACKLAEGKISFEGLLKYSGDKFKIINEAFEIIQRVNIIDLVDIPLQNQPVYFKKNLKRFLETYYSDEDLRKLDSNILKSIFNDTCVKYLLAGYTLNKIANLDPYSAYMPIGEYNSFNPFNKQTEFKDSSTYLPEDKLIPTLRINNLDCDEKTKKNLNEKLNFIRLNYRKLDELKDAKERLKTKYIFIGDEKNDDKYTSNDGTEYYYVFSEPGNSSSINYNNIIRNLDISISKLTKKIDEMELELYERKKEIIRESYMNEIINNKNKYSKYVKTYNTHVAAKKGDIFSICGLHLRYPNLSRNQAKQQLLYTASLHNGIYDEYTNTAVDFDTVETFCFMTDTEETAYHYLYNLDPNKAAAYLWSIQEEINKRAAEYRVDLIFKEYSYDKKTKKLGNNFWNSIVTVFQGSSDGMDTYIDNVKAIFNSNKRKSKSVNDYEKLLIMSRLNSRCPELSKKYQISEALGEYIIPFYGGTLLTISGHPTAGARFLSFLIGLNTTGELMREWGQKGYDDSKLEFYTYSIASGESSAVITALVEELFRKISGDKLELVIKIISSMGITYINEGLDASYKNFWTGEKVSMGVHNAALVSAIKAGFATALIRGVAYNIEFIKENGGKIKLPIPIEKIKTIVDNILKQEYALGRGLNNGEIIKEILKESVVLGLKGAKELDIIKIFSIDLQLGYDDVIPD